MRQLRLFVATALACALFAPASSQAFSIAVSQPGSKKIVQWAGDNISYFLHQGGCKQLSLADTLQQWKASFEGWMAVPCTNVQFIEQQHCQSGTCKFDKGKTCNVNADCPSAMSLKMVAAGYNTNGRNELAFLNDSAWTYGTYVLGVTTPVWDGTGKIFEADIAFNGYLQKWTTNPKATSNGTQHLLSVAIHEVGHFFGVQHVLPQTGWDPKDPPTMAPAVDPYGNSWTLNADDSKVVCFLHPKTGYTCAGDVDCPYIVDQDSKGQEAYIGKMTCTSGQCTFGGSVPVGGQTELGQPCSNDDQCKSSMCQPVSSTQAFCSQLCTPQTPNCPPNFDCYPYQNDQTQGACLPSSLSGGGGSSTPKKQPGEACAKSSECTTLLCVQATCRVKCTPSKPTQCKADEVCNKLQGLSIGACVPAPPSTKKPEGGDCTANADCQSDLCVQSDPSQANGQCRQKCGAGDKCPTGTTCVAQVDGAKACLPGSPTVPAGSACTANEACDTNLCLQDDGGKTFCSKFCLADNPATCPCGMSCENTTMGLVCIPGKKVQCVGLGAPCAQSSECIASAVCNAGVCKKACTVGGTDQPCAPGEACLRLALDQSAGICGAVGPGSLGVACSQDNDCQSGFCAPSTGTCETPCDPTNDTCGEARYCQPIAGVQFGVCLAVPEGGVVDAGGMGGDAGAAPVTGVPTVTGGDASGCSAGTGRAASTGAGSVLLLGLAAGLTLWRRRRLA